MIAFQGTFPNEEAWSVIEMPPKECVFQSTVVLTSILAGLCEPFCHFHALEICMFIVVQTFYRNLPNLTIIVTIFLSVCCLRDEGLFENHHLSQIPLKIENSEITFLRL